jgi:hypothetical protein
MSKALLIDYSGMRFGKWLVIKRVENCRHLCKCDCGAIKAVRNNNLVQGNSKQCRKCGRVRKLKISLEERFFSKVEKTEGCWFWKSSTNQMGYGQFTIGRKPLFAHRICWELTHGKKIPEGLFACHKCDTPICVNPDHIFLGTHQQNSQDMSNKKRSTWGEKSLLSKLNLENVRQIKRMLLEGVDIKIICEKFQVVDKTIRNIRNKKTWKHLED